MSKKHSIGLFADIVAKTLRLVVDRLSLIAIGIATMGKVKMSIKSYTLWTFLKK
jgi:hypothetical protein